MDDAEYIITLASGGSVRVTSAQIEVQPGQPELPPDITDMLAVKGVTRKGSDVIITRVRRRTMQITLPSPEDAAALETHIRAALGDAPAAVVPTTGRNARWLPLAMLVCALLVAVGSLGPWLHAPILTDDGGETVYGSQGDGSLTIIFGFMAGALAGLLLRQPWRRGWTLGLLAIAFMLSAVVGMVAWVDVGRAINDTGIEAKVGWGLPLMTIAAAIGVALALAQYRHASHPAGTWESSSEDATTTTGADEGDAHAQT